MEFVTKLLEQLAGAVNALHAKGRKVVTVAAIRHELGIPSDDRSRISFFSQFLEALHDHGYLEEDGAGSPHRYRVCKAIGAADALQLLDTIREG